MISSQQQIKSGTNSKRWRFIKLPGRLVFEKVLYEEIMMNNDNFESNLLTSSLLKMCSLLQVEPEICAEVSVAGELLIFI